MTRDEYLDQFTLCRDENGEHYPDNGRKIEELIVSKAKVSSDGTILRKKGDRGARLAWRYTDEESNES